MTDGRAEFVEHFRRVDERDLPEDGFRVHFVDVGGGQSVIVQTAEETLLYDAGPTEETGGKRTGPCGGEETVEALRALGIDHVDHVFVSHVDTDHYAQLAGGVEENGEATDSLVEELGADGIGAIHFPGAAVDDHDLSFPEAVAAKRVVGDPVNPEDAEDVVVGRKKGTNRVEARPADEADGSVLRDTTEVEGTDVVRLRLNKYIEGLANVIDENDVETRWVTAEDPDAEDPQIALGDVDVTVLNPPEDPENNLSEDDRSVVLRLWHPEARKCAYLTGDLNGNRESSVFEQYAPVLPELDSDEVDYDHLRRDVERPEGTDESEDDGDEDQSEDDESVEAVYDVEKHGSGSAEGYVLEALSRADWVAEVAAVMSNDADGKNDFPEISKGEQLEELPARIFTTADGPKSFDVTPDGIEWAGSRTSDDESAERDGEERLTDELETDSVWRPLDPDRDRENDPGGAGEGVGCP